VSSFGALRDVAGTWLGYDARPIAVKNFLGYSLRRLGVDYIDIYRPSRLDPNVPILGALDVKLTASTPGTAAGERYPAAALAYMDSESSA
jgi:aryl-alcohol dehydrogenase-like predicted oxidoreductase